jgi:hypothetical protein
MRPSTLFFIIISLGLAAHLAMQYAAGVQMHNLGASEKQMRLLVKRFGLSDVCIASEARYIRHLAVSDPVSPYMDHPGAIEHFPSGSFWVPKD